MRRSGLEISAFIVALAAVAAWSPRVAAHRFTYPKVLRIRITDARLRLEVSYDLNPGAEARVARATFDRDTSGTLDAREQAALAAHLEARATRGLRIALDDRWIALAAPRRVGHRLDRPAGDTSTLGVALIYTVPLPAASGPRTLRVRDGHARRDVPARLDVSAAWRVLRASQGEVASSARRITGVRLAPGRDLVVKLAQP